MGAQPHSARRCKYTVEQIGAVLRQRREHPSASAAQIARDTGVSVVAVRHYLGGTLPRLYLETLPGVPVPRAVRHYVADWV